MTDDNTPAIDADQLLQALVDAATGDTGRAVGYFEELIADGADTTFALTCALANAINVMSLDQNNPNMAVLEVEGDPAADEEGRVALQAMRIVTCVANRDFETAFAVWSAGTAEQACEATGFLIRIAVNLIRRELNSEEKAS
jgi:hypothetical protein